MVKQNILKLSKDEIKYINEAIKMENKTMKKTFSLIRYKEDIITLPKEEILYICIALMNKLSKKDNYKADKLASRLLQYLGKRSNT